MVGNCEDSARAVTWTEGKKDAAPAPTNLTFEVSSSDTREPTDSAYVASFYMQDKIRGKI